MTGGDPIHRGRDAFARRRWADAWAHLSGARANLGPDDLEMLATAAYLTGRDDDSADAWTCALAGHAAAGQPDRAAFCGFRAGLVYLHRGEAARAGGWFGRARRLLDAAGQDGVARGYLLVPEALRGLAAGDVEAARRLFGEFTAVADRFGDRNAMAMARLGTGQALIAGGDTGAGLALLDEVMVAIGAGEVSPIDVGIAYCAAVLACQHAFDLRRAQEWTAALGRWCAGQPDLVPYRGQCLVHRAEVMQWRGDWPDALREATHACRHLERQPASGPALALLGDLHRLRGSFGAAEAAYRDAGRLGHEPQPGLALLRLAQGRVSDAYAAIRRVLCETGLPALRARVLPAYVEIALSAGETPTAGTAVEELGRIAAAGPTPLLTALAGRARGHLLLATGDATGALPCLRESWRYWHNLTVPYEAARTRVLIGRSCAALGDADSAAMELDAARRVFRQLGAAPDLAGLETRAPGGLTRRETEVLRLVAAGLTNRGIAAELFLSERTVARHVANIFGKLGVANRSAATAYAYRHDLAGPDTHNYPVRPGP
ncbi:helix-turn-helix transcriptional regulator [Paractinoplanes rishiriensis]|uniref:Helix-turn-helix transcriptional regulator n=1 Tax=Paractinoplanes rishiriensis TaxID=1050105 RepID=A0A919K1K8_9ACTN|nr:helix-turn-helix transcriptional regulator [Actinoplanes rishiriensis]GIE97197.1 helix-turn-helix transcriptional regulator [Actinoplanes rishiriensis]